MPSPRRASPPRPGLRTMEVGGYVPPQKPVYKETPQAQMPPAIMLGRSQIRAHDAVMAGKSVFITGPGGTGKSELLRKIIKDLRFGGVSVAVTASTGVAALLVGGSTIHSFLGTNICGSVDELRKAYTRDEIHVGDRRYTSLMQSQVLIVDEVSMLTGDYLDMTDYHLRDICGIEEPFGGKQVVFCGDFLQLPPVIKNRRRVKGQFAFQAKSWEDASVKRITLTENFRQQDVEFRKHLDAIRFGELTAEARDFLRAAVKRPLDTPEPMRLYPINRKVDTLNNRKLGELQSEIREYTAHFTGIQKLWKLLAKSAPVPPKLTLKTGARVMLCRNDPIEGYCNGDRGLLLEHTEDGDWAKSLYIELERGGEVRVNQHAFEWKDDKGEVLATMEQYPIKLAWAVSIHKSQGATLDNVICDLRGVFEAGQVYVALSRVREAEGLSLASAILRRQVFANRACMDYYPRVKRRR